ncbi:hypothetical protein JHK84_052217 [Glycine max]|nr:hypothetical protein JHK86_052173 [Glycine max]KAG4926542.1 hypothetical protein JHK85_053028 [Glycine max]KAG5082179.1 hypothetical protein JHK84_052217 [Glycine max]
MLVLSLHRVARFSKTRSSSSACVASSLKLKWKTRIESLKKKVLNTSSKFKHSLKKKSNRRKSDDRVSSVLVEDVQNFEEQ